MRIVSHFTIAASIAIACAIYVLRQHPIVWDTRTVLALIAGIVCTSDTVYYGFMCWIKREEIF